ncbi:MAG: hypothetical protein JWN89_285 [Parcubacteria group bacterium]|nr:hypothetical protein [Parcubacteria group bacterium]
MERVLAFVDNLERCYYRYVVRPIDYVLLRLGWLFIYPTLTALCFKVFGGAAFIFAVCVLMSIFAAESYMGDELYERYGNWNWAGWILALFGVILHLTPLIFYTLLFAMAVYGVLVAVVIDRLITSRTRNWQSRL